MDSGGRFCRHLTMVTGDVVGQPFSLATLTAVFRGEESTAHFEMAVPDIAITPHAKSNRKKNYVATFSTQKILQK